jgi:hypothetical protein
MRFGAGVGASDRIQLCRSPLVFRSFRQRRKTQASFGISSKKNTAKAYHPALLRSVQSLNSPAEKPLKSVLAFGGIGSQDRCFAFFCLPLVYLPVGLQGLLTRIGAIKRQIGWGEGKKVIRMRQGGLKNGGLIKKDAEQDLYAVRHLLSLYIIEIIRNWKRYNVFQLLLNGKAV